ncbi:ISAs1 family transposase [Streptomyces sp. NBC_00887]|nr:ISAs1 family transposase [Streptomyces sp. NBC_00887]WSY36321.1 ISAs1 family transposase [Streptomyces sp. NBC_00887]
MLPLPGRAHPARRLRQSRPSRAHAGRVRPPGWPGPPRTDPAHPGRRPRAGTAPHLPRQPPSAGARPQVDSVVTADALHAQRDHAAYLLSRRSHYLFTIKSNQPTLARRLHCLPWKEVPVLRRSTERGHGREEIREVQVASVDGLLFPQAKQVLRIRRRRRLDTKKWSAETVYAVTDLAAYQGSADELAAWARGHWIIENSVHWIRDCTFGEDASQVRTRNSPAVMAALRDIVRATLRFTGWTNTSSGRRAQTNPRSHPHTPRRPMIKPDIRGTLRGPGAASTAYDCASGLAAAPASCTGPTSGTTRQQPQR